MTESGYVRLTPEHDPMGVSWWFSRRFDDGFAYARGGRARSARAARKLIRTCWSASLEEHRRFRNRPTHKLGKEGELVPLELAGTVSQRARAGRRR